MNENLLFLKEQFLEYYRHIKRQGAEKLLYWLERTDFFMAPASTIYHGAKPGGLLEHSVNVYLNILQISKTEEWDAQQHETLAICGLLHDICKVNTYKDISEDEEEPRYMYVNDLPIGHGEKSVILILQHMKLSDEEMMAICWHMGGFDYREKGGSKEMNQTFKKCKLAAMLHIADMMATHLDERKEE